MKGVRIIFVGKFEKIGQNLVGVYFKVVAIIFEFIVSPLKRILLGFRVLFFGKHLFVNGLFRIHRRCKKEDDEEEDSAAEE